MPKQYVDRGATVGGQNKTSRDSRVPYSFPRALDNFRLPDQRLRRRGGYGSIYGPVRTQALCKSTGVSYHKRTVESNHGKEMIATSPLSYGLIRWQTDYQLRRAESKTIEFCIRLGDKENLVREPFVRLAKFTGQWGTPFQAIREAGVYVLDQTIISNHHKWDTGTITHQTLTPGTTYDLGAFLTSSQFDVFPLPTMCFGFTETQFWFNFGMVESTGANTGRYWTFNKMVFNFPGGKYNVGDIYHVAVVYNHTLGSGPGRFILYINGTAIQTLDLPVTAETFKFIGEFDVINGITYASGQQRDIVLLNETTARGSYSSAVKIRGTMHGYQTFFHDLSSPTFIHYGINPWALSPPRGTAMWDLRIWNEARSAADILANSFKRLLPTDSGITNLKGNWHLNDGSGVCTNKITGRENHWCCLHHGFPSYVNVSNTLNGIGLKLGEGQHLIKRVGKDDRFFGSGFAAQLDNVFTDEILAPVSMKHRGQHSFSVQIQVMIPDAFQPELNDKAADPLTMKDLALVETRRFMNTGAAPYDALHDGVAETSVFFRFPLGHATDPTAPYDVTQHLRAYDQTLWSIEGTQRKSVTDTVVDEADRRRIPVARGVLTPSGKVAFELFKAIGTSLAPKYLRLLSATTLTIGSVYTLTFVQRPEYVYDAPTESLDISGWRMELWIQNITAGTPATLDALFTVLPASNISTVSLVHEQNYDIIVGASYVNCGWDHSINMPFPAGVVPTTRHSYVNHANTRGSHGPWPVAQRFMSPYQDQPGNFVVSMFRLWSSALRKELIDVYGKSEINSNEHTVDLLANLEFKEITGIEIPNKSRYPDNFRLGYKGWGMPQGYRNLFNTTGSVAKPVKLKKEMFEAAWSQDDCLGYMPIDLSTYNARQLYTRVNGLAVFKASFAQQFGVLSVFGDSLAYDETVDGTFIPLHVSNHGLMSEFYPGLDWRGTLIGDRTFLTSGFALPKVFNGKTCTIAGFKRWHGGRIMVYETDPVLSGDLIDLKWYGVALVYWSETYGIYHVSPVATIKTHQNLKALAIAYVPPHPDFRVSNIEVYRTLGQATESLAASAPLIKTRSVAKNRDIASSFNIYAITGMNASADSIVIEEGDANLSGVILDRNVTEFPVCAFSAALDDRLYLAGDVLNPDTWYFTDAGNSERIDFFFNSGTLPEGSGDAVTGMLSAFGAIFIFKPNVIWRIDNIGGNNHQVTKIAAIGPVSEKSLQLIVNPDTGRTEIFFWSQHGPYVFDGTNANYIGYPIEQPIKDIDNSEYHWLLPSTVVVGHSINTREIICFYTPRRIDELGVATELDRNGEAMVYNYRFRSWYRYSGTICTNALSLSFSGSLVVRDAKSNLLRTDQYKLIIGGQNGKLYAWGADLQDGVPTGLVLAQNYALATGTTPTVLKIPTLPYTHELLGCWVTVVNDATGDWFTAPIDSTDSVATTVTINISWLEGTLFEAAAGDTVYVCRPPAKVEYPWDELDQPLYDKMITELITWHDKAFKYRTQIGYTPISDFTWKDLSTSDTQRKRTQIGKTSDAIKLELASFDLKASLDAFAYEVLYKQGAETHQ